MLLKQKRKLQEELDEEKIQNRKITMQLSDLENRNMGYSYNIFTCKILNLKSLEKINYNNASFENEQNQKYKSLKQKFQILKEKKQELENEVFSSTNQLNEQNILLSKLQNEKQEIRKRFMSKNKEFEKLYRDFCKIKEESELNHVKSNAETEKLHMALQETEKKLFKGFLIFLIFS